MAEIFKTEDRGGLETTVVDGRHQTEATEFPESYINHTVLSCPKDGVKTVKLDCYEVEIKVHRSGHFEVITKSKSKNGKGTVSTYFSILQKPAIVLARKVVDNSKKD